MLTVVVTLAAALMDISAAIL